MTDRARPPASPPGRLRRALKAPLFSPAGFLVRAALLGLAFLLAHLAGLRGYAAVLAGTPGDSSLAPELCAALGGVYLLLYFAAVVLAPSLALGAVVFHFLLRLSPAEPRP